MMFNISIYICCMYIACSQSCRVSCFEHSGARRESDWNPHGFKRIPHDDGAAFTADGFTSHQHQNYTRTTPHAAHTVSESSFAPPPPLFGCWHPWSMSMVPRLVHSS